MGSQLSQVGTSGSPTSSVMQGLYGANRAEREQVTPIHETLGRLIMSQENVNASNV